MEINFSEFKKVFVKYKQMNEISFNNIKKYSESFDKKAREILGSSIPKKKV